MRTTGSIILLLMLGFIACKKDPPPSSSSTPRITSPRLEPVKDTCYNVVGSFTQMSLPIKVIYNSAYYFSCFDPVDQNIVYSLFRPKDTITGFHTYEYRFLKTNLATGDTSSFLFATRTKPEIDRHGWMYYLTPPGLLVKSRLDGSQRQEFPFPIFEAMKVFVNPEGTELFFYTFNNDFYTSDGNGHVKSHTYSTDYLSTSPTFIAASPDLRHLIFWAAIDTFYKINRETKEIEKRFYVGKLVKEPHAYAEFNDARVSNDGKMLISGTREDLALIYIDENRGVRLRDSCKNRRYRNYRFSPDDRYIISTYNENNYIQGAYLFGGSFSSIMDLQGKNEQRFKVD